MSITLQEIKDAVCGQDVDGKSKAISIIGAHKYDMSNTGAEPIVIAEFSSLEPIVSVIIGGEITWVSLKFTSDKSGDLSLFFRTLERYLEETDNNTESSQAVSFISLIPIELAGQYYINAMNPIMWAIEPESVGEDARILRVAFFSEDVSFLESDLDDDFFDRALEAATESLESDETEDIYDREYEYGQSDRDDDFIDEDKYIADLADRYSDDEDEDDDDFEDIGGGDDDRPNDRESYVYK